MEQWLEVQRHLQNLRLEEEPYLSVEERYAFPPVWISDMPSTHPVTEEEKKQVENLANIVLPATLASAAVGASLVFPGGVDVQGAFQSVSNYVTNYFSGGEEILNTVQSFVADVNPGEWEWLRNEPQPVRIPAPIEFPNVAIPQNVIENVEKLASSASNLESFYRTVEYLYAGSEYFSKLQAWIATAGSLAALIQLPLSLWNRRVDTQELERHRKSSLKYMSDLRTNVDSLVERKAAEEMKQVAEASPIRRLRHTDPDMRLRVSHRRYTTRQQQQQQQQEDEEEYEYESYY